MNTVDVLAVLDRLSENAATLRPYAQDTGAFRVNNKGATELAEACAAAMEVAKVKSAVAELAEAIRPLADLDLRPDGFDKRDDSQPVYARDKTVITVGDVRRAAAALARFRGGAE